MATFCLTCSSRRLLKPSYLYSSSLYLSLNSFSPSITKSSPKLNNSFNHSLLNSFEQTFTWKHIQEFNFRSIAHLSTSSSSDTDKKDKSRELCCSWIDKYLPRHAQPFARLARLDKPIGTWLLAWPCMWYAFISHTLSLLLL